MNILAKFTFFTLIAVFTTSCITPFSPEIEQGKHITKKQLNQIQPNMSKKQISYILGTPNVIDPFHVNQWNYIYLYQKTRDSFRTLETLSLKFDKSGDLIEFSGNIIPPKAIYKKTKPTKTNTFDNDYFNTLNKRKK